MARFVEKTRSSTPASAAKMEQLFAGTDVIEAIGQALAPIGLRIDNVADVYAAWWTTAGNAAQGNVGTPNRAEANAVRAQAARTVVSATCDGAELWLFDIGMAISTPSQRTDRERQFHRWSNDTDFARLTRYVAASQGARKAGRDQPARLTPMFAGFERGAWSETSARSRAACGRSDSR